MASHSKEDESEVRDLLIRFEEEYELLYNGRILPADDVRGGDALLCDEAFAPMLRRLLLLRGDMFTSDREVAALYRAYKATRTADIPALAARLVALAACADPYEAADTAPDFGEDSVRADLESGRVERYLGWVDEVDASALGPGYPELASQVRDDLLAISA